MFKGPTATTKLRVLWESNINPEGKVLTSVYHKKEKDIVSVRNIEVPLGSIPSVEMDVPEKGSRNQVLADYGLGMGSHEEEADVYVWAEAKKNKKTKLYDISEHENKVWESDGILVDEPLGSTTKIREVYNSLSRSMMRVRMKQIDADFATRPELEKAQPQTRQTQHHSRLRF